MDPNVVLAEIRRDLQTLGSEATAEEYSDHVSAFAERVKALDKHLTEGGKLPDPWAWLGGVKGVHSMRAVPLRERGNGG